MPKISEFLGVTILVRHREHGVPHFHATYAEWRAIIAIANGEVLAGQLPPRALRLIHEWLDLHREEVQENWECAQAGRPCFRVAPLGD